MRKICVSVLFLSIAVLIAAQFVSCEKYVLPDIQLERDTLFFGPDAASQHLRVITNVTTTAKSEYHWASADPDWFEQTSDIVVSVLDNPESSQRVMKISIKSESVNKALTIVQEGRK